MACTPKRAACFRPATGLGYPGQEFVVEDHLNGERYVCEGGESQDLWYYGRNAATGVRGWVNYCNISYEG